MEALESRDQEGIVLVDRSLGQAGVEDSSMGSVVVEDSQEEVGVEGVVVAAVGDLGSSLVMEVVETRSVMDSR